MTKKYTIVFTDKECLILKPGYVIPEDMFVMRSPRSNDIYVLNMNSRASTSIETCFVSKGTEKDSILWHRRMGHIHVRKMNYLMANDLVEGVSLKNFKLSDHYVSCKKGKQMKKSHLSKLLNSIDAPLERLHMDLFGPVNRPSISGDWYCLVVTDDYSRYSWVLFMSSKDQTPVLVQNLITKIESLYKQKESFGLIFSMI